MKLLVILLLTFGIETVAQPVKTLGKRKLPTTSKTVSAPVTNTSASPVGTTTVNKANPNAQIAALPKLASFASIPYELRKFKLPFSSQEKEYWVKKVGHYYILNGDIIVGNDFPKTMSLVKIDEDYRWANGTIPIVIDKSIYDNLMASHVHAAIREFNDSTELCLVPRTTEKDYVKITFTTDNSIGGFSSVGRQGGEQTIFISDGATKGTVIHEIMHSAGFFHEQSRFDRDKHIRIIWKNIEPGMEYNFQMEGDERALGGYDWCSIMHYGVTAFGKPNEFNNNARHFTMQCVTEEGRDRDCDECFLKGTRISIGHPNRVTFSPTDITSIDEAYNTISRFPCQTPFPDPRPVQVFTKVNVAASDEAMQAFRHRAEVASKTGYPAAFPNMHYANHNGNIMGGTIFIKPGFTVWEDVPLIWLGNPAINDFAARMRATQRYAVSKGYVAGFPNYFHADYGKGIVCGTFLLGTASAEWRDVPVGQLGNPNFDDIRVMMTAANDYAFKNGFVGGFPTFERANYGAGMVYGMVLIRPGAAEWKDVIVAAGPR